MAGWGRQGRYFAALKSDSEVLLVIRHPWSGEGPDYSQLLQAALQRGGPHRVAVIGMQDQRLLATFINPLSEASPAHQSRCDGWILTLPDIPGHHLAAPHVDHQIEVEPHTSHSGRQVGDVPALHLIWPSCAQAWNRSGLLWWPGSSPPMGLPVCMEHPIEAAL
jgi:hypothetical protein